MKSSLKIVVATAAIALGFVSVPAMAGTEVAGAGRQTNVRYDQYGQQAQQPVNPCDIDSRLCRPSNGANIGRDLVNIGANGAVNALLIAVSGGQQRQNIRTSGEAQMAVDTNRGGVQMRVDDNRVDGSIRFLEAQYRIVNGRAVQTGGGQQAASAGGPQIDTNNCRRATDGIMYCAVQGQ